MEYVISDIHGDLEAWNSIKEQIQLNTDDRLYILGDVIDRGEHGIEILQEIMNTENMYMLLGNHEYMMMNALGFPYRPDDPENRTPYNEKMYLWWRNGGEVTRSAYAELQPAEKLEIQDFLQSLPLTMYAEVNGTRYIMVHANWEELFNLMNDENPEYKTYFYVWDRDTLNETEALLKIINDEDGPTEMIFGHTPTIRFKRETNELDNDEGFMTVYKYGHLIDIDCGAAYKDIEVPYKGRLACLRLNDMKVFYSRR